MVVFWCALAGLALGPAPQLVACMPSGHGGISGPSPIAKAAPGLAPAAGKQYRYRTESGVATYTITAYEGDQIRYDLKTEALGEPPSIERSLTVERIHGVFWPVGLPNPVSQPIGRYPTETVTLPAGTVEAARVVGGTATAWFVSGWPVRIQTAYSSWVLEEAGH